MKTRLALAAGAVAFIILATANSGGYRYGVSDQAFYIPAVAIAADASAFPRDAVLFAPQMRWWLGDDLLAKLPFSPDPALPAHFFVLYLTGLVTLFAGGAFLARGLGASWWTVAAATALLSLRHRIAKTGVNSLEGYMHPRVIAFGLGLLALGFILRRRAIAASVLVAAAAVVHPTTAVWFALVVGIAAVAQIDTRSVYAGAAAVAAILLIVGLWHLLGAPRMDDTWLAVLGEKDYLFPHEWPAYAWLTNLLYPAVLLLLFRHRRALGDARQGERALVIGLVALVGLFLVSVPLAAARIAPVVQLQVNRVFWLIDAVAVVYVAWWLIDRLSKRRRTVTVAIIALLACARGGYVFIESGRPLISVAPATEWARMLQEVQYEPLDVQVLADPGHAAKYGVSVRVGAFRDTVLEQSKDSAMAMYDREIAMRVAERIEALSGFEGFSAEKYRELGRRFDAALLLVEKSRALALPLVYETNRFALYDLR